MREVTEMIWLDAREVLTLSELEEACAVRAAELQELVDEGVLQPVQRGELVGVFSAEYVMPLRKASRLRQDFDLDLFTVGLLLEYLLRIDALETKVHSLQARLGQLS
jgi:chaperone modulatory protein CbpM